MLCRVRHHRVANLEGRRASFANNQYKAEDQEAASKAKTWPSAVTWCSDDLHWADTTA